MWKARNSEEPPVKPVVAIPVVTPMEPNSFAPEREATLRSGIAEIGKSTLVKGELSGNEDLYIDGEMHGKVELPDQNLTIGPNGRVNANLHARQITVLGKVHGDVHASNKIEIRKSGSIIGDIVTARILIEDGAYFKGSVDLRRLPTTGNEVRKSDVAAAPCSAVREHAELSALLQEPDTLRRLLGDFRGAFSVGVGRDPDEPTAPAIIVQVEGTTLPIAPPRLSVGQASIRVITKTGFVTPQPLKLAR